MPTTESHRESIRAWWKKQTPSPSEPDTARARPRRTTRTNVKTSTKRLLLDYATPDTLFISMVFPQTESRTEPWRLFFFSMKPVV